MQRKIKFIGWNPNTKEIVNNFNDCCLSFKSDNSFNITQYNELGIHVLGEIIEDWNSLILMQFTGLKDKNGKEIYESFIIKKGGSKFVIEFRDGGFEMVGIKIICVARLCSSYRDIEIIGNIYENPELLNDLHFK